MDTTDIEDVAKANEKIKAQAKEIAELKFKLSATDEHCASFLAAYIGCEFQAKIDSLSRAKDAALSSGTDGIGLTVLTTELNAWQDAKKILLGHTALESTTAKALATSLKQKPFDKREKASMERIIAALAAMADLDLSQPSKAAVALAAAAAGRVALPKSPTTVETHLEAAFLRAENERHAPQ